MSDDLQTAKSVERGKLTQLLDESAQKVAQRTKEMEGTMVARGMRQSGPFQMLYVKIRIEELEHFVQKAIEVRRELIARVPSMASDREIRNFQSDLEQRIDRMFEGIKQAAGVQGIKVSTNNGMLHESLAIKARMKRSVAIMRDESKLPSGQAAGTIHISAGHGSIVTVGNVTSSILTTLSQSNADVQLRTELGKLANAIQQSTALNADLQKEALENLEFVVRQVTSAPSHREKAGVIQTVWNTLAQSLSVAADLVQICGVVGPLVLKHLSA